MSEFKNVTAVREANVFFNGGVVSRTVIFPDGSKKTLGIMQPGRYEFSTKTGEEMEILSGELDVLLPGKSSWIPVRGGESFRVGAGETFTMVARSLTDYCCHFLT